MRISKAKRTVVLGHAETKKWEDAGEVGATFRAEVRKLAAALATRGPVEVYASARDGGWKADVLNESQ